MVWSAVESNRVGRGTAEGDEGEEVAKDQDQPNKGFDAYCNTKDEQGVEKRQVSGTQEGGAGCEELNDRRGGCREYLGRQ